MRMEKSNESAPPMPTSPDLQELILLWFLHWSGWEREKQGKGQGPVSWGPSHPLTTFLAAPHSPVARRGVGKPV